MAHWIEFRIEKGDITELACDVLALKYAQAFYGVDRKVAQALSEKGISIEDLRPGVGDYRLAPTHGAIAARYALFVGVVELRRFGHPEITEFSQKVFEILFREAPVIRHLASTIHGTGYGVDEVVAFVAQCAGFLEAMKKGILPANLKQIAIVDRDLNRVESLCKLFETDLAPQIGAHRVGDRIYEIPIPEVPSVRPSPSGQIVRSAKRPHVFVAMSFDEAMNDVYRFGIEDAVTAAGFVCERTDQKGLHRNHSATDSDTH